VASASCHEKIDFRVARAESSGLDAASVDLVTVGQALHWFDIVRFFSEAMRVFKPGGVLAVWCHERCRLNVACEEIIEKVFAGIERYWPAERAIVDDHYQSITLPVAEFPAAAFRMSATWIASDMRVLLQGDIHGFRATRMIQDKAQSEEVLFSCLPVGIAQNTTWLGMSFTRAATPYWIIRVTPFGRVVKRSSAVLRLLARTRH